MNKKQRSLANWMMFVIGVCLSVAVAVTITTEIQKRQLVEDCVRATNSKIIQATFYENVVAGDKRLGEAIREKLPKDSEEYKVATEFKKTSVIMRATIQMPDGWVGNPKTRGDDSQDRRKGCEDTFKSAFSWIE